jgi:hypothetical protein
MKIYIASSWKNQEKCLLVARLLRSVGHEVDCFCDDSTGRYAFHWTEIVEKEEDLGKLDQFGFQADTRTWRAFREDMKWLDWADAVVLLLPSGRSAHLEAGYKKGQGGQVFILGGFPAGEYEVMYCMADGVYRYPDDVAQFIAAIRGDRW